MPSLPTLPSSQCTPCALLERCDWVVPEIGPVCVWEELSATSHWFHFPTCVARAEQIYISTSLAPSLTHSAITLTSAMFGAEPKHCLNQGKTNTNREKIFALPGIYIYQYIYCIYSGYIYSTICALFSHGTLFIAAVSL